MRRENNTVHVYHRTIMACGLHLNEVSQDSALLTVAPFYHAHCWVFLRQAPLLCYLPVQVRWRETTVGSV